MFNDQNNMPEVWRPAVQLFTLGLASWLLIACFIMAVMWMFQ
jgi:hypothetical protein